MSAFDFQTGKNNKATWDGTDVCITNFTYNEEAELLDTTNSCTGGVETNIIGAVKYSGTFELFWDDNARPTEAPNIMSGEEGTLNLYINGTDYFSIPAMIMGVSITSNVKEMVKVTCNWQATAEPTYPA
jgi:hypothetical protein